MRTAWKKCISLALATVMALSLAPVLALGETNQWGWDVPEETFAFSVYAGNADPAEFAEDREKSEYVMDNFLKDEFNVVIDKSVYLDEVAQRINLMLINDDYPDMLTWVPEMPAIQFIEAGRAIDLMPLLEEYGPNILAEFGDYIELLKEEDGSLYKLPTAFGFKIDTVGDAFSMRYDWWLELDQPMYTTPEEFYEQMKMVLENHPTNESGQPVYALTSQDGGEGLLKALQGAWGFKSGYDVADDGTMTYWLNTDRAEEIATYINRFYREGMIDPDFVTNKYEDAQTKSVNDRLAGYIGIWWHMFTWGHEYWQEIDADTPIERRFMNVSVAAPGVEEHTLTSASFLRTNGYWMITDKCENPEMLVKWLNWEMTPVGTLLTTYGVPGPENVYDIVDGKVVMREESLDASKKNVEFHNRGEEKGGKQQYWLVARQSALAKGAVEFPYELDPRVADSMGGYDVYPKKADGTGFLDPGWDISWGYYDDSTLWDSSLFNVSFPVDEPITVIKQNTDEIMKTEFINIVTADSEEACLAALEAARAKMEQAGISQIEAYRTEAYQRNLEKMGQ